MTPPNSRSGSTVIFQRKAGPHQWSVERVFSSVLGAMPPESGVRQIIVPHVSIGISNRVRNILFVRRHRGDVNHIAGDIHYVAFALPRRTAILTILDLRTLSRISGIKRFVFSRIWYDLPVRWCRSITTISAVVRDELVDLVPSSAWKVTVVECPVGPEFCPAPIPDNAAPVGLHIGTGRNKNLENTIAAFTGTDAHLRIIGELSFTQQTALDSSGVPYTNSSNLSPEEMVAAYRESDFVMFMSTYEGFGMPIVEAQATGRPVITSDRPPMSDIAGDGALLADPTDISAIRQSVIDVTTDPSLRDDLIRRGHANVARFTPEQIAEQYRRLYEAAGADVASHRTRLT